MSDRRFRGRKESSFPVVTEIPSGGSITGFNSGLNFSITFDNFLNDIGVTGSLAQDGAVTGTPVLDGVAPNYLIRNLEDGSGIISQVSPENGITLKHNFTADSTGVAVLGSPTATSPVIRSLVEGNNINLSLTDDAIEISTPNVAIDNLVIVKAASDLAGTLSSTAQYFIDGVIDMGTQSIEVPQGGLNISGADFNLSGLVSTENSYTMFTSPVTGSGDLIGMNFHIETSGTGSKVFDLVSDTGNEAIELERVNYNNCTSLGVIDNYRQGLETGTGRFGGQPSLELKGVWSGGFRITTSITRSIDNAMTDALFKAGTGFSMSSRFLTDMNVDLGTLAPFVDFAPANFPNPSTLQIGGAIITRNGVSDPEDATIIPNIAASDLASSWSNNVGIPNTFVGGTLSISTEIATVIAATSTFVDLAGTWAATDLQHFDSPANGQLRNLGDNPREFRIVGDLVIDGPANDEIKVRIRKWDNSASSFVTVADQVRQINSLIGGRNVAFFNATTGFTLDQNDYIILQVSNESSTGNLTVELDSFWTVLER